MAHVLHKAKLVGQPIQRDYRVPVGRLWPCGDFSTGSRVVKADDRLDHRRPELWLPTWKDDGSRPPGAGVKPDPLDLREVSKSHSQVETPKKPRGTKGITSYGRKMVKSAGALIKRRYPRHRPTFCTITLPRMTQEQRRELVGLWPELVRQVLQTARRYLERQGLPPLVVSVSEIQPKRLEKTGEAYLHLHLLWLNGPQKGSYAITPNQLRSVVSKFCQSRLSIDKDFYVNVDTRLVRKDVTGYLAKYLSKGTATGDAVTKDLGEGNTPRTWWNMTAPLRKWVKSCVASGEVLFDPLLRFINDWLAGRRTGQCHYARTVDLEVEGRLITVGWRGAMRQDLVWGWLDAYLDFRPMLWPISS